MWARERLSRQRARSSGTGRSRFEGTRYGPDLSTPGIPDDETQLLVDGRRIEDLYRIPLGSLFRRQGSEWIYAGNRHVEVAREEISRLQDELAIWILIDETTALGNRQRIWDEINQVIQVRLFGIEGTSGYPVRGSNAHDARAFELIDEVLAALESQAALEVALESGGVFTDADNNPIRDTGASDIWNRAESRLSLWLGSTDYTRFGAWRKQTSPNASAEYLSRLENNENGPNAFAYSSLPQTTYSSERDANYPAGVVATYSGETVAVQGTAFYTGAVELMAQWHAGWLGASNDQAGTLTAVISGLGDEHDDPLLADTVTDGRGAEDMAVAAIIFPEIAIRVASDGRVYFKEDGGSAGRVRFVDQAKTEVAPDLAMIEGKFVGQGLDGPPGVIGIWTVRDEGDTRLGTGDILYGAFGAELGP